MPLVGAGGVVVVVLEWPLLQPLQSLVAHWRAAASARTRAKKKERKRNISFQLLSIAPHSKNSFCQLVLLLLLLL